MVATGTASGKSLAYELPVLTHLLADQQATALYLAPTKALGADQIRAVTALDLPGVRPASFDGDTAMAQRDWVRAHARWVFTNPDMLHHGLLARHDRWARLLRRLSFVAIDECHASAACSARMSRCCAPVAAGCGPLWRASGVRAGIGDGC